MEVEINNLNLLLENIAFDKGREEEEKWESPKGGDIKLDFKDF